MVTISHPLHARVDQFVERFESSRLDGNHEDVLQFLPEQGDPDFVPIATELLRVDLEMNWSSPLDEPSMAVIGKVRRTLSDYPEPLADLLLRPECVEQLAYEEYRLRLQAGDTVRPEDYAKRYRIDTSRWPVTDDTWDTGTGRAPGPSEEASASSFAWQQAPFERWHSELMELPEAVQPMPAAGGQFAGFQIIEQIGQGAFSRVFLASQNDLAARDVVLKISSYGTAEPQRLARLQHANIVPIHSVHHQAGLHAICMPYFGTSTLRDVLNRIRDLPSEPTGQVFLATIQHCRRADGPTDRAATRRADVLPSDQRCRQLANMDYAEACLCIARDIAEGLGCAHRRGIAHRDLKPENILLTDDGHAMLLDFNVADSVSDQTHPLTLVGGSLAYMAPEHLLALETGRGIDLRSDVFSFGVLLFQLLTTNLPYPAPHLDASVDGQLKQLAEQRRRSAPNIRTLNRAVPHDVAAIVHRCLQGDPDQRYASMEEVREDLYRTSENLPLRGVREPVIQSRLTKWCRRHPQFISRWTLLGVLLLTSTLLISVSRHAYVHEQQSRSRRLLADLQRSLPELRVGFSSLHADSSSLQAAHKQAIALLQQHGMSNDRQQVESWIRWLSPGDQARLQTALAELFYLMAHAQGKQILAGRGLQANEESHDRWQRAMHWNEAARHIAGMTVSGTEQAGYAESIAAQAVWLTRIHRSANDLEPTSTSATADADAANSAEDLTHQLFGDHRQSYPRAVQLLMSGKTERAIAVLEALQRKQPWDVSTWLLLGDAYMAVGQTTAARSAYDAVTTLWPASDLAHLHRGIFLMSQRAYTAAVDELTSAVRLNPDRQSARLNLAICYLKQAQYRKAETNFSKALEAGCDETRIYHLRAKVREKLGDKQGAQTDRRVFERRTPSDPVSWIVRGNISLKDHPDFALTCYETARALDPFSHDAYRNLAHVLAERLEQPHRAIEVMSQSIRRFGARPEDIVSRGVLQARVGNRKSALADAHRVADRSSQNSKLAFQLACLYALCANHAADSETSQQDIQRALCYLGMAIQADTRWLAVAVRDDDLNSLRNVSAFRQMIRSASLFQQTLSTALPAGVTGEIAVP